MNIPNKMGIELSVETFEAIKRSQGWTDEEAKRWLNNEEPFPIVRYPDGTESFVRSSDCDSARHAATDDPAGRHAERNE